LTARPFNGKLVGWVGLTSCAVLRPGGKGAGVFRFSRKNGKFLTSPFAWVAVKRRRTPLFVRQTAPFGRTAPQANGEVRNCLHFCEIHLKIPRPLAPRPENGAGRQAGYAKQGGREKGFKGKKRKMSYRGEWEWFYLVRM